MQFFTQQPALGLLTLLMPLAVKGADYHGAYFVLTNHKPIVTERLDPVMAAGQNPSNHVHEIFGANTFGPTFDYDAAQKSSCNTNGVKIDHSNYWYPAMYFNDKAKGTYERVPTDLTTYYHYDPTSTGARKAFPKGFKMISGNAMLRHNDTATNPATHSIRWYCHGTPKATVTDGGFGTGFDNCKDGSGFGYSSELWFPFCHNGNEFNPKAPMDHMAFGQGGDGTPTQQGGSCPSSHPTALPQIFAEFHHDTSQFTWSANEQPFVLAQGDPTGFGMHADFVNGWEDGLQHALDLDASGKPNCNVGESGEGAKACFEQLPDSVVSACQIAAVVQGDPDINSPGTALPGCNPMQTGPADATIQTNCAGYKAPAQVSGAPVQTAAPGSSSAVVSAAPSQSTGGGVPGNNSPGSPPTINNKAVNKAAVVPPGSASSSAASSSPSETGNISSGTPTGSGSGAIPSSITVKSETWTYQGCYSDLVPNRSIRTLSKWGRGRTSAECAASCAGDGFKISGVEFGNQCFCDNKMTQTKKLDDSKCNFACKGSASEMCGGDGALQVYAKSGTNLGLGKRSPHAVRHIRDFQAIG